MLEQRVCKINYVPEGFELTDIHEGHNLFSYDYLAKVDRSENKNLTS